MRVILLSSVILLVSLCANEVYSQGKYLIEDSNGSSSSLDETSEDQKKGEFMIRVKRLDQKTGSKFQSNNGGNENLVGDNQKSPNKTIYSENSDEDRASDKITTELLNKSSENSSSEVSKDVEIVDFSKPVNQVSSISNTTNTSEPFDLRTSPTKSTSPSGVSPKLSSHSLLETSTVSSSTTKISQLISSNHSSLMTTQLFTDNKNLTTITTPKTTTTSTTITLNTKTPTTPKSSTTFSSTTTSSKTKQAITSTKSIPIPTTQSTTTTNSNNEPSTSLFTTSPVRSSALTAERIQDINLPPTNRGLTHFSDSAESAFYNQYRYSDAPGNFRQRAPSHDDRGDKWSRPRDYEYHHREEMPTTTKSQRPNTSGVGIIQPRAFNFGQSENPDTMRCECSCPSTKEPQDILDEEIGPIGPTVPVGSQRREGRNGHDGGDEGDGNYGRDDRDRFDRRDRIDRRNGRDWRGESDGRDGSDGRYGRDGWNGRNERDEREGRDYRNRRRMHHFYHSPDLY